VEINYATRRARVRWDERRIRLSGILAAIAAIGYRAHPYDAARSEEIAGASAAPRCGACSSPASA
jgi:Cu2+-exporting ATPase